MKAFVNPLVNHLGCIFFGAWVTCPPISQCERPELFVPLPSMRPVMAGKNYERKARAAAERPHVG